jgi:hypothetical protein
LRRATRLLWTIAAAIVAGTTGCGAGGEALVAHVGDTTITSVKLLHWMSLMAPEHLVPDPPRFHACIAHQEQLVPGSVSSELWDECRRQYRALQQRALGFLIYAQWLDGAASEFGAAVSDHDVAARLKEGRLAALPGRPSEADVELAVRAELAAVRIRHALAESEPAIGRASIRAYYTRHISDYERRELREIEIVERLPTKATAVSLIRARGRLPSGAIRESINRPSAAQVSPEKRQIMRAIFTAGSHRLVGPEPLNRAWAVFESPASCHASSSRSRSYTARSSSS